jgi:hypothetical protein
MKMAQTNAQSGHSLASSSTKISPAHRIVSIAHKDNPMKTIVNLTLFLLCAAFCAAQTSVSLSPVPQMQFLDQNAKPLAFGCVFTYASGTSTPLATYTDYTGTVQNGNPITLSASGAANIWLQSGQPYTFTVKSTGGTDCSLGTLMYSVDGIGAGGTQLTTVITQTSGSVSFIDQSQNQLYKITLAGDMVGLPISAVGVTPPGFITFEITQDGVGSHIFTWPSNTIGGCTISPTASNTTLQTFVWDGTNAIALGPCTVGAGPTISAGDIYDIGLSASGGICTDANKKLTSSCGSINTVTYNGQAVANGGTGNVNVGAAAHSVALNQGNGNALTGLTLATGQFALGSTGADPTAANIATCTSVQASSFSGTAFTCVPTTALQSNVVKTIGSPVSIAASPSSTTVMTQSVTMPSTGCPCRASVSYGTYWDTSGSGQYAVSINDGSSSFATAEGNTTGSASDFGISSSGYSIGTYANGAVVTFTMKASQTAGGTVNIHVANATGLGQSTWMQISIFTSN